MVSLTAREDLLLAPGNVSAVEGIENAQLMLTLFPASSKGTHRLSTINIIFHTGHSTIEVSFKLFKQEI